jgi:1-deoxy-D-xylulose-5-phosphate reductoisomerase
MNKRIVILGSTGSIGRQTLDIAKTHHFGVIALSAHSNAELLEKQAREFSVPPENTCLSSETPDKLRELAAVKNCVIVNAVVGSAGLKPTLSAIEAGNAVALANKETLVAGGEIVIEKAREKGVPIIPVDSEHSAIFQCLNGQNGNKIRKIILTASGGAFFGYSKEQLKKVTREQALRHANRDMGAKVTVDSATLMNKGLELIEAVRLFGVDEEQIEVVIHPQSIVHSAVEFEDGSVISQMGVPDMRLPIQYALTYPERLPCPVKRLSLTETAQLTFSEADERTFICLALAREAVRLGGNAPCILNAADESAVKMFLNGEINFDEIPETIAEIFAKTPKTKDISLDIIEETEKTVFLK